MLPFINNLDTTGVAVSDNKVSMRQYDGSPIIQGILDNWNINFDTNILIEKIFTNCMDIRTCTGIWLDIWGRKVGVNRAAKVPVQTDWFGFDNSANDWFPFDDGVFYSSALTESQILTDDAYRLLILSKAGFNVTACDSKSINAWLNFAFAGRGKCYVQDNHDMTISYIFNFTLKNYEVGVLIGGGVLPRPAGISATLVANGGVYDVA